MVVRVDMWNKCKVMKCTMPVPLVALAEAEAATIMAALAAVRAALELFIFASILTQRKGGPT